MKMIHVLMFLIGAVLFASPPPTHATPVATPQHELSLSFEMPSTQFVIVAPRIDTQPGFVLHIYKLIKSPTVDLTAVLIHDRIRIQVPVIYVKRYSQNKFYKDTIESRKTNENWVPPVVYA